MCFHAFVFDSTVRFCMWQHRPFPLIVEVILFGKSKKSSPPINLVHTFFIAVPVNESFSKFIVVLMIITVVDDPIVMGELKSLNILELFFYFFLRIMNSSVSDTDDVFTLTLVSFADCEKETD